jgi:hypothetical protein
VNFHTKNAITPITATPPATERPTMVDVETPELLLLLLLLLPALAEGDGVDDCVPESVTTAMTVEPPELNTVNCVDVGVLAGVEGVIPALEVGAGFPGWEDAGADAALDG